MKVLGTNTGLPYDVLQKIKTLSSIEIRNNKFRIICRCKGLLDGNRKCEAAGLGEKVFSTGYTSIVVNKTEIELCKIEDLWICKNGTVGDEYISIKDL